MAWQKMDKDNKKTFVITLVFVVIPVSIGALGWVTYRQDHKMAGIVDYKAGHTQKAIQELQDYLKDHPLHCATILPE